MPNPQVSSGALVSVGFVFRSENPRSTGYLAGSITDTRQSLNILNYFYSSINPL
jgi:hypothetical protein